MSGIPARVLKTFSRRTEQIEALAAELGVRDPELKGLLGAKTRASKQLRFTLEELRRIWQSRLPDSDRSRVIAVSYLDALDAGKSVLTVSPTHAEGNHLTRTIRAELRQSGKLHGTKRELERLDCRDLTRAERQEPRFYREGDVIEFHTQAKGFRAGAGFTVTTVGRSAVAAKDENGRETIVPLTLAERFQVYTTQNIVLAVWDRIRITKNGNATNRTRLDNGMIALVVAFSPDGGVELENGAVLPARFAHFANGYVVTSHASQGKTVDRVLIAQSSESFPASSREQFYVSASRGRESVTVFTDDKHALRRAILRSDPHLSATELMSAHDPPLWVWRARFMRRYQSLNRFIEKGITRLEPLPNAEYLVRSR